MSTEPSAFFAPRSPLLSLPLDIRTLIYDILLPSGYLIHIRYALTTTVATLLPLIRTSRQLHAELSAYLAKKPIVLYCARGNRPTVIHQIPRPVRAAASVVVIEDQPTNGLELALLPGLRSICFCAVYVSQAPAPDPGDNDAILKMHHAMWKDLRIENRWIRVLWKNRPDVQVVLRVAMEVEDRGTGSVVAGHHSVVDVDLRRVVEKGPLPGYVRGEGCEDVVFAYGNVGWWRRPQQAVQIEWAPLEECEIRIPGLMGDKESGGG